jgi:DNA-binding MarR family transcriptional regulator
VNRMEKIGLVKKIKNKNGKKFLILVTEKGDNTFKRSPNKSLKIFLEGISPEEKQQFGVIVQKLLGNGRRGLGLDHRMIFLSETPIDNSLYDDKGDSA